MPNIFNSLNYEKFNPMDYEFFCLLEYLKSASSDDTRNPLEALLIGRASVYEYVKKDDENGVTQWVEELVAENVKCRLSHRIAAGESMPRDFVPETFKQYQLYTLPDVNIRANSKIVVTQRGLTGEFSNSGIPSRFEFHNQLEVIPFVRWA